MDPMEHTGFPSDETLAAFLDGRLDPETRRRVIEHMTTCDECYSVVAMGGREGRGSVAETGTTASVPRSRWRVASWSVAAALALTFGWLAFRAYNAAPPTQPSPLELLAKAAPPKRRFEGRIVGFPFQAFDSPKRGAPNAASPDAFTADPDNWSFVQAATQVQKAAAAKPSPITAHAIGVSQLMYGQVEQAVDTLERALLEETRATNVNDAVLISRDAGLLNDLSAAYLAKAVDQNNPHANLLAWNAAERAWKLSRVPEVAWNRALAASKLNAGEVAQSAWGAYEAVETSPQWKRERQQVGPVTTTDRGSEVPDLSHVIRTANPNHLRELVIQNPRAIREYVEDHLIPDAAEEIAQGGSDQLEAFALARHVAQALTATTKDRFSLDEIEHLDLLRGDDVVTACRSLVAYGQARALYRSGRISEASQLALLSEEGFHRTGEPFAVAANLTRSSCLYYLNEYAQSLQTANQAASAACPSGRYLFACGDSRWLAGMDADVLGRPYDALVSYHSAHQEFQQAKDGWGVAAVDGILAASLDRLGRDAEASEIRDNALRVLSAGDDRRDLLMADLGRAALASGLPMVAEQVSIALTASANRQQNPAFEAQARAIHSAALDRQGEHAAARAEYAAALALANVIPEPAVRTRITSLVVQLAPPATQVDADAATSSTAIVAMEKAGQHFVLGDLYGRRAAYFEHRGDTQRAMDDYGRAISEIDLSTPNLADEDSVSAFVSHYERLYDGLMRGYLAKDDVIYALACAETSRAVLADSRASRMHVQSLEQEVSEVTRTLKRVPRNTTILDFVVSDDDVTLFVVENNEARCLTLGSIIPAIDKIVDDLTRFAQDDLRRQNAALQQLYSLLLKAAEASLDGRSRLVIVTDKALENLPFPALMDESGRYVIERVVVTRSADLRGAARSVYHENELDPTRILIVAASAFDRTVFPNLTALDEIDQEARALTAAYQGAKVLAGAGATRSKVMRGVSNASVVYIASHALFDDRPGRSSCLVLASGADEGSGTLCASDVAALHIRSGAVIVLDACRAGARGMKRAPGASSLASSFLHAGATEVVAPVSSVSDRAGMAMITAVADYLRSGKSAALAVSQMQKDALSGHGLRAVSALEWGVLGAFQ